MGTDEHAITSGGRNEAEILTDSSYAESIGHALLSANLFAIVALDDRWRIVAFNPAAESIFGRSPARRDPPAPDHRALRGRLDDRADGDPG
jgi:PAS domain-containing protein